MIVKAIGIFRLREFASSISTVQIRSAKLSMERQQQESWFNCVSLYSALSFEPLYPAHDNIWIVQI